MLRQPPHIARIAAILAAAAWTCALLVCGAAREGYAQSEDPVALLGAAGTSGAMLFNVAGFLLPGALAAVVAWRLRADMPATASWAARIGASLVLLGAFGFALQGVFPIDAGDLDASASRAHAIAWTLWWLAFVPGALLLAVGSLVDRSAPTAAAGLRAAAGLGLAAAVLWCVAFADGVPGPALAQRVAYAAWLLWLLVMSRRGVARLVVRA